MSGIASLAASARLVTYARPGEEESARRLVASAIASGGLAAGDIWTDARLRGTAAVSYTHLTLPTNREV